MVYYRRSSYNSEEMIKKAKYRALLYKMQSILNKTNNLDNKLDNIKSNMKTSLIIDGEIFEESTYDGIDSNVEELASDIQDTINTIRSNI